MTTAKNPQKSPQAAYGRGDGDPVTQFAAIVWKGGHAENIRKLWFNDPVEALAAAVEYLKKGYQARLSDGTVAHFAEIDKVPVGPPSVVPLSGGPS
ncbi:MAG TPA: hypothetical protein VH136_18525 [Trebonia sp.]|jgi:hypothetical protein|nr:hypothetical protein [Trebonia sp.]